MTNPTLSSPLYAQVDSLEYQIYKKQHDRKRRNNPPPATERYFRRNKGASDYATIPAASLSEDDIITFKYLAPPAALAGSQYFLDGGSLVSDRALFQMRMDGRFNFEFGWASTLELDGVSVDLNSLYPTDGAIHSIRIICNSSAIGRKIDTLLARFNNTSNYIGVMYDLTIEASGGLTRSYAINDNQGILVDAVGGFDGAVINGSTVDWGFFYKNDTGWIGSNLDVPPWDSVNQELVIA